MRVCVDGAAAAAVERAIEVVRSTRRSGEDTTAAEAALDALDESRYVAWADDMEVAGAWYLFPRFREEQERGRILPLTPVSARGLQPEDVAAIERFAREAQQAGIPD